MTYFSVPIFNGSPRLLPFVSVLFLDSVSGYPAMTPLASASMRYHLIARPDVRPASFLWKENIFIGPGLNIPGVESISTSGVSILDTYFSRLSKIRIAMHPSVPKFEQVLLDRIMYHHAQTYPESILTNLNGDLNPPVIMERRLHLGYHNTFTFIHPPHIINIQHIINDPLLDTTLQFLGNIELDKYMPNQENVSLVFMIEYKVSLTVNAPKDPKRWRLLEMLRPSGKEGEMLQSFEKFVCVGWGSWNPTEFNGSESIQSVSLDYASCPNPFTSLMYRATPDLYNDKLLDDLAHIVGKEIPHTVSFQFNDDLKFQEQKVEVQHPQLLFVDTGDRNRSPFDEIPEFPKVTVEPRKQVELHTHILPEPDKELIEVPDEFEHVIEMPSPKPSKLKSRLSRVERARLLNAGFSKILTESGDKPTEIQLNDLDTSNLKSNLDLEMNDSLANEVTIDFLGVTFDESMLERMAGNYPGSVYFSFQFYNFPHSTTERLKVYTGSLPPAYEKNSPSHARSSSLPQHHNREWSHLSQKSFTSTYANREKNTNEAQWPAIFYRFEQDGRPAYDRQPGLKNQFTLDPYTEVFSDTIRYGQLAFPYYMAQKQLYIDVWDGDTLLHLGTSCLDLRTGMRQGKAGVVVNEDVDIMWHQFADDASNQGVRNANAPSSSAIAHRAAPGLGSGSLKLGSLHISLTNIGRTLHPNGYPSNPSMRESVIVYDYHENAKLRLNTTHDAKKVTTVLIQLADVDVELHELLQSAQNERIAKQRLHAEKEDGELVSDEIRRLQKVYKLLEKDHIIIPKNASSTGV